MNCQFCQSLDQCKMKKISIFIPYEHQFSQIIQDDNQQIFQIHNEICQVCTNTLDILANIQCFKCKLWMKQIQNERCPLCSTHICGICGQIKTLYDQKQKCFGCENKRFRENEIDFMFQILLLILLPITPFYIMYQNVQNLTIFELIEFKSKCYVLLVQFILFPIIYPVLLLTQFCQRIHLILGLALEMCIQHQKQ